MQLTTKLVVTGNHDPHRNLAVEEYLLNQVGDNQAVLYLWQNQNTVVIGKNQNPWKECRPDLLASEGGKLARRLSGGGAVFHDLGNLNFTFILDRRWYDLPKQLGIILAAVRKMGIAAEFSGRNDLTVAGKKFSGNAFYLRANSAMHHGTLLLSADLERLTRYLQVSREKIRAKGIESVRSRVINLQECLPTLSISQLSSALSDAFQENYGRCAVCSRDEEGMDQAVLDRLYAKYSSWDWRFGEAPEFDIEMESRFPWGGVNLCLQLENATIKKAYLYSDAMDATLIEKIPNSLIACPFRSATLANCVRNLPTEQENQPILEDIAQWLEKKCF